MATRRPLSILGHEIAVLTYTRRQSLIFWSRYRRAAKQLSLMPRTT
jgi:hypothetical protein